MLRVRLRLRRTLRSAGTLSGQVWAPSSHRTPAPEVASSTSSSFPLLEHFSMADSFQSENGDDILTVTETSHGLNFEYKWEQARAEQPYCSSSASGPLGKNNPHYQDVYYPLSNSTGSCKGESLPLGVLHPTMSQTIQVWFQC